MVCECCEICTTNVECLVGTVRHLILFEFIFMFLSNKSLNGKIHFNNPIMDLICVYLLISTIHYYKLNIFQVLKKTLIYHSLCHKII